MARKHVFTCGTVLVSEQVFTKAKGTVSGPPELLLPFIQRHITCVRWLLLMLLLHPNNNCYEREQAITVLYSSVNHLLESMWGVI